MGKEARRRECLLLGVMVLCNLRDKLPVTYPKDKTQRLQWKLAFQTGSVSKEPQCVVTSLTPGKRMSSGINRSLCSQTRGTLSSENSSSAVPSGDCMGDKGWDVCELAPHKEGP